MSLFTTTLSSALLANTLGFLDHRSVAVSRRTCRALSRIPVAPAEVVASQVHEDHCVRLRAGATRCLTVDAAFTQWLSRAEVADARKAASIDRFAAGGTRLEEISFEREVMRPAVAPWVARLVRQHAASLRRLDLSRLSTTDSETTDALVYVGYQTLDEGRLSALERLGLPLASEAGGGLLLLPASTGRLSGLLSARGHQLSVDLTLYDACTVDRSLLRGIPSALCGVLYAHVRGLDLQPSYGYEGDSGLWGEGAHFTAAVTAPRLEHLRLSYAPRAAHGDFHDAPWARTLPEFLLRLRPEASTTAAIEDWSFYSEDSDDDDLGDTSPALPALRRLELAAPSRYHCQGMSGEYRAVGKAEMGRLLSGRFWTELRHLTPLLESLTLRNLPVLKGMAAGIFDPAVRPPLLREVHLAFPHSPAEENVSRAVLQALCDACSTLVERDRAVPTRSLLRRVTLETNLDTRVPASLGIGRTARITYSPGTGTTTPVVTHNFRDFLPAPPEEMLRAPPPPAGCSVEAKVVPVPGHCWRVDQTLASLAAVWRLHGLLRDRQVEHTICLATFTFKSLAWEQGCSKGSSD